MRHHIVQSNGIQLSVADLGEGPAVLFCHGFPAIGSSWRGQMEAVAAAGYRALALDMRGYGASEAPDAPEAYMPFHTVGDLVGLLDHFGLADCVIVGHDFGASVAWNAALMRPDRFRAVFGMSVPFRRLGGPSFLDGLRKAGRDDFYMFAQMRPEADAAWADAAVTIPGVYYYTSGQAKESERWNPFDAAATQRAAPEPLNTIDPAYIAEAVRCFQERGFHGPLNYYRAIDPFFAIASGVYAGAVIHQPSWFLTGALDGLRLFHPSEAEIREDLPDLRGITILPNIGHWPQLEAAEEVNRTLLDFLAEIGV